MYFHHTYISILVVLKSPFYIHKGHIYVGSTNQFPDKPSDKNSKDAELVRKILANEIPSIEVKTVGGLVFCSNSKHEEGKRYEIRGKLYGMGEVNTWKDYLCKIYFQTKLFL